MFSTSVSLLLAVISEAPDSYLLHVSARERLFSCLQSSHVDAGVIVVCSTKNAMRKVPLSRLRKLRNAILGVRYAHSPFQQGAGISHFLSIFAQRLR